ncbi:hypothetical protein NDU88_003988 [Pleurodeles waltl]|uniref:Uncharacterized protein n=1 Tax=Pleurodeles waltl TaxID=8319 RepID=A0AAV7T6U0_PLEWA|nr:hypothetical protein NDU88_003988 [Pleurodeles waltl]
MVLPSYSAPVFETEAPVRSSPTPQVYIKREGGPDEIHGYSPDETRVDKGTKEEVAGLNGNFGTNYIRQHNLTKG